VSPKYESRAVTISGSGSLSFAACGASLSLGRGGGTTSTFCFFFGASSPLSPVPPAFALLPDARGSSSLSPLACSSSSHFLFDMGFNTVRSFDNSGRKHFCFLPKHSLHATPVGVRPRGTPWATVSFHLLIRAGSTQQRDPRPSHALHWAGPTRSSSSTAFAFPFPFFGEAPSSTSMASSGW